MITEAEIVASLTPLNGGFFAIANLKEYAEKVRTRGKCEELRNPSSNELLAYILYYDDGPELFITMVWTAPQHRGQGLARRLLLTLMEQCTKAIRLEVHQDNPAKALYQQLGFLEQDRQNPYCTMRYTPMIAIMQPYLFPYLGYFHLIEASEQFVFYDDVNFIKKGWINRNRILLNGEAHNFTVPLKKASQNRLIMDTQLSDAAQWRTSFMQTLRQAYGKAPQFPQISKLVHSVFEQGHGTISELAIHSIAAVYAYLDIDFTYARSSEISPDSKGLEKATRLLHITQQQGFEGYVNAAGGEALYDKGRFVRDGVTLAFLRSEAPPYSQGPNDFVPNLSIIDVLMFNDKTATRALLKKYRVV